MQRADWWPTAADVGAILRARTMDTDGNEIGTFNSSTRPTGDQVSAHIDTVVSEVYGKCGKIPDEIEDWARRLAAVGAACLVESGFFPNEIRSGFSPYPELLEWYKNGLVDLKGRVDEINQGEDLNTTDDTIYAIGDFPIPCGPNAIIGWNSRW